MDYNQLYGVFKYVYSRSYNKYPIIVPIERFSERADKVLINKYIKKDIEMDYEIPFFPRYDFPFIFPLGLIKELKESALVTYNTEEQSFPSDIDVYTIEPIPRTINIFRIFSMLKQFTPLKQFYCFGGYMRFNYEKIFVYANELDLPLVQSLFIQKCNIEIIGDDDFNIVKSIKEYYGY